MSSEAYVDLRHLNRIADDVDNLSACVIRVGIDEIEYKRESIKEIITLLKDILQSWEYFSEYDIPIGIKESIENVLIKI